MESIMKRQGRASSSAYHINEPRRNTENTSGKCTIFYSVPNTKGIKIKVLWVKSLFIQTFSDSLIHTFLVHPWTHVYVCYYVKVKVLVTQPRLTLRLHGLQLTRLLCPWNYPGRNTGVDGHSILQGIFPTQRWNSRVRTAGRFFTISATSRVPGFHSLKATHDSAKHSFLLLSYWPGDVSTKRASCFQSAYPSQPNFILSLVRFLFAFRRVYVNNNKNNNETKKPG